MSRFKKGDRVRVISYAGKEWIGNTGIVTREPGEEANPGLSLGPSGTYAMTFDGRGDQVFAPFRDDQLELVEFEGWVITRDHIDAGRVGYGQRPEHADQTTANYQNFRRVIECRTDLRAQDVRDPVDFRVLDDDGEVYYEGVVSRSWADGDEERCFSPLTFAQADAGAVDLQHKIDGKWVSI